MNRATFVAQCPVSRHCELSGQCYPLLKQTLHVGAVARSASAITPTIRQLTGPAVAADDVTAFIAMAVIELANLHEGNTTPFRIPQLVEGEPCMNIREPTLSTLASFDQVLREKMAFSLRNRRECNTATKHDWPVDRHNASIQTDRVSDPEKDTDTANPSFTRTRCSRTIGNSRPINMVAK